MPTKIGEYQVRSGTTVIKIWPLTPETTYASATAVAVAPQTVGTATTNTLVAPPVFGIIDVLISLTDDDASSSLAAERKSAEPVRRTNVTEADSTDRLLTTVSGPAAEETMPLLVETDGTVRIRFGVAPNSGDFFEGTLRLVGDYGTNKQTKLELPIKVQKMTEVADLFVFFVVHRKPKKQFCWVKVKTVEQAVPTTAVPGASVRLKLLRDNLSSGYDRINREVALASWTDGSVGIGSRVVLGLPIHWPIVLMASKDDFMPTGYVPRGHLIRLKAADIHDNLAPLQTTDIRMTRVANARMTTKRILLDPGHGVVYALTSARRCQEWFVAHKIADELSAILQNTFGLPEVGIFRTRTAGFGLIDPADINGNAAPETGAGRYEFRMVERDVRVKQNSLGLHHISNLVLTQHNDDGTVQAVAEADRNRLVAINSTAIGTVIARINAHLPSGQRVQPDSVRWREASGRYVYTIERVAADGTTTTVQDNVHFPINTTDHFVVDDAMVEILASRSAQWSLAREIGSGPAADAASGRKNFTEAARDALTGAGALDYMRDKILSYANVAAPHPYLDHGSRAWGPSDRLSFLNGIDPHCDIYLTIHENAGGGKGGMTLVSHKAGIDAPPDEQVRIAKIFLKYVDGFDRGTRQGGIVKDLPTNPAGMLYHANQRRDHYAYFELEFMDAIDPDNAARYTYNLMAEAGTATFVGRVARQLAAGIVEVLFDRQSDLDGVTYRGELTLW